MGLEGTGEIRTLSEAPAMRCGIVGMGSRSVEAKPGTTPL